MYVKLIVVLVLVTINSVWMSEVESSATAAETQENYLNLLHQKEANEANAAAVLNAISQLSEKRQSLMKRNLFKRIQVPFKWGKRSQQDLILASYNRELDKCDDLFIILMGPNRNELTKFDPADLKAVFNACFSIWIEDLYSSQESSSREASVDKRSFNTPFKWG